MPSCRCPIPPSAMATPAETFWRDRAPVPSTWRSPRPSASMSGSKRNSAGRPSTFSTAPISRTRPTHSTRPTPEPSPVPAPAARCNSGCAAASKDNYMTTRNYILAAGAVALLLIPAQAALAQATPPPCAGLPPGKHSLLERMTAQFSLTCEQELKIEPLLHDEESVTKPLLKFPSFSAEEQQDFMLKIKLAARNFIKPQLTADQQKLMDQEIDSVAKTGKKGGAKKGTAAAPAEAFEVE